MSVQCVATGDTGMQTGYEAPGRTMGFELFDDVRARGDRPARPRTRALTLLDAVPAPSGRIPVVLKRGAGGVLFHEACGHGLEADHILKDASVFKGQTGRRWSRRRSSRSSTTAATAASGARSRSTTKAIPRSATC